MILKIKKLIPEAIIPKHTHEGDAGLDLSSLEDFNLALGERHLFKTGLQMEIPIGFFGSIRDRSGLAFKAGIHVLAGVIDAHYRGDVGIILINLGKEDFKVSKEDRIAQILIQKVESPEIQEVKELSETTRGNGGFGSTGR